MNSISLFIACSALALLLLAASFGCGVREPYPEPQTSSPPPSRAYDEEPIAPGGTEDRSDPGAAKAILSEEISRFECSVSLKSYALEANGVLRAPRYEFSALRSGNGAECSFRAFPGEAVSFIADEAFLDDIQRIVKDNGLASFNGRDRTTYGLPDDFGASLETDYASGEKIRAYDNSDMFLPFPAVEALVTLFGSAAGPVPYTSITAEEAVELMERESGFLIVDVRREDEYESGHIPGAILLPNEEIQLGNTEPLPDRDRLLLIYCRTGRRSKEAAGKLSELGYTRVFEFGGIVDWPGDVVTE
jgi:rhodanese-related sulfurtransferase